ncbi:MAG: 30S ribosomal protein S4 [Deltaproteobacteria bacterium RBG_13_58_19]|nr:MAG: 30S ribosomal protein S4 [Deltaproteobacteria bacterium RBG_13_58_19]
MARYTDSRCRICRREKMALYLKGDRCYTDKCAIQRRSYPPGQHGQSRGKISDYGIQLREKQKVKRMYGLLENQFRGYFKRAERQKGVTGTNLLILLERRLDNVAYRLGFANSRAQARQLVTHNHILVNGRKVNLPSFLVEVGSAIQVAEKSRNLPIIRDALEAAARRGCPPWLELIKEEAQGKVIMLPTREDFTMPIQEHLIVELYSK